MAPFTHPDFATWAEHLSHARNGHSRPLGNNTKVRWGGEDSICFDLHSTAIVTLRRDGSRVLRTGGWLTVTTKDRIHQFGSRFVSGPVEPHDTSAGWTVRAEDDPKDPHPLGRTPSHWGGRATRTILKPFHAPDPGPEPVDDGVGCIAGTCEAFEAGEYATVYDWSREQPQSSQHVTNRHYGDGSGPALMVYRTFMTGNAYGVSMHNSAWGEHHDKQVEVPEGWTYKQCPHCKAFQELHARWHVAYNGKPWGRGRGQGYRQMCEALERFGTREAWQAAYLTELREVRELNAAVKAWEARNFLPFYDSIEVTPQGFAPLKAKRAHCRELEAEERERRRVERVKAKNDRERAKVQAKIDHERALRRQITQALAESMVTELEIMRGNYPSRARFAA